MSCMFSQITFLSDYFFPRLSQHMSSSVGIIIPNIWKIEKCSKPPTSHYYQNDSKYLPKRDVNWPFPVSLRWRAQFTDRSGRRWNLRGRRLKSSAEQMLGVITSSNPRARYLKQTADSEWWNSVNAGHTGQMPCVKRTLRSCCC